MPTHHREHRVKTLAQSDRPPAALEVRSDADDPRHASRLGPLQHLLNVAAEIGIIEVRMRVVEHSCLPSGHRSRVRVAQAQVTCPLRSSRMMLCRKRTPFSNPSRAVIRLSSCSIDNTPSYPVILRVETKSHQN